MTRPGGGRVPAEKAMGISLAATLILFLLRPAAAAGNTSNTQKNDDLIDWLPNSPEKIDFHHYSGYVVADPKGGVNYFYYFVEAVAEDPVTKPLILYLGCQASLCSPLTASYEQVGPFKVDTDGQSLLENPHSWNREANLLFVDSPVTVGFSYFTISGTASDVVAVPEIHRFLAGWLKRFPEYRASDLYIAGQTDIGNLGPALALRIVHHNRKAKKPAINLKGLIMGGPALEANVQMTDLVDYYWQSGLVSSSYAHKYRHKCANVSLRGRDQDHGLLKSLPARCLVLMGEVDFALSHLDPFSLYAPPCPGTVASGADSFNFRDLYTCDDQYVAGYLTIPFVQKAMHVRPLPGNPGPRVWMPVYGGSTWDPQIKSSLGMVRALLDDGIRVLIYSGVFDYNLPLTAAQETLRNLNMTVDTEWRAWFGKSAIELAGYSTSFKDGLTYATVRNSGRKFSKDQPENTYVMVQSFLNNQPLPRSPYFPDA